MMRWGGVVEYYDSHCPLSSSRVVPEGLVRNRWYLVKLCGALTLLRIWGAIPRYIFPVSPVLCSEDSSFCKHLTHLDITYD